MVNSLWFYCAPLRRGVGSWVIPVTPSVSPRFSSLSVLQPLDSDLLFLVTVQFSTVPEPSQLKAWVHMSVHSPHLLSSVLDYCTETSVCHLAHQQADALLITSWIFCHNTIRSILCLKQNPAPPVRNSFFVYFTLSSPFQDLQLLPFFPHLTQG